MRRVRAATAAFAAVELFALVLWLVIGRFQWFYNDDWDVIATRKAGDLGDLFRPHGVHWTTIPILVYRFLYWSFGLRTYFPYRVVVVLVHLLAAGLLVFVMRRAGVRPWIATAAGSLFVLFGAGWQNILFPFQITFTGSLVFGLVQLLAADHDGPLDRRDWLGLVAGLGALMCSGVGVTMVVIVGIAVFLRRGWRIAAFHTVPLAACYLAWLGVIGHDGYAGGHLTIDGLPQFVAASLGAAYRTLGPFPWFGVVFVAVLVTGSVLAWRERRSSEHTFELAIPVALLAGSVVFAVITATGRSGVGSETGRTSRYLYLVVALTLPALAIAADALATRWRWFLPIAMALFLVGIPENIYLARHYQRQLKATYEGRRALILSLPRDQLAQRVPRSLQPEQVYFHGVTIGWLLDGVAQHRIPAPDPDFRRGPYKDDFRLSFDQQQGLPPTTSCRVLHQPLVVDLHSGDALGISNGALEIQPAHAVRGSGPPLVFLPADGTRVVVLRSAGPERLSAVERVLNWRMKPSANSAPRVCFHRSRPRV